MIDGINRDEAMVIFCDLNAAYASAEQQAKPSLRGRPMGVTNRLSKQCCIIACSYEAKQLGIKTGARLDEARALCPDFVVLEADPPKYHWMYKHLVRILKSYSPNVAMCSIDEGLVDMHDVLGHNPPKYALEDIGMEIKRRMAEEVGNWMKINIGIGPNRFLAKQAAIWHKPDGLDRIDHHNLTAYYKDKKLTDLTGIASKFEARLNAAGIFTPTQFLKASPDYLHRYVFHSVLGDDWHKRLRGIEVDNRPTQLGNVGRQWILRDPTEDEDFIRSCFQFLCQTTGKKLRYRSSESRGMFVFANSTEGDRWYSRKMFKSTIYTDPDIYLRALTLLNQRPRGMRVQSMGLSCYEITPSGRSQLSLFESVKEFHRKDWLSTAVDEINERFGTFMVYAAQSLTGVKNVGQKVPFGGTEYFDLLLKDA